MNFLEKTSYLLFLINCFQSIENEMVRKEILQYSIIILILC